MSNELNAMAVRRCAKVLLSIFQVVEATEVMVLPRVEMVVMAIAQLPTRRVVVVVAAVAALVVRPAMVAVVEAVETKRDEKSGTC